MKLFNRIIRKVLGHFGVRIIQTSRSGKNQDEITLHTYNKYYPEESIKSKRFYNLGAGRFRHQYWTNIDKLSGWYNNVQEQKNVIDYDFFSKEKLPLDSASAELFYSSHAIEHITDEEIKYLFAEVHRILKTGGIFRITCPNIDLDYRAFLHRDIDFFYFRTSPILNKNPTFNMDVKTMNIEQAFIWHIASNASIHHSDGSQNRISDEELRKIIADNPKEIALDTITSRADVSKQKLYPGNHINWFNFSKLDRQLRQAGFSTVNREAYGQSSSPVMRDIFLFDSTHPKLSLYMEAVK